MGLLSHLGDLQACGEALQFRAGKCGVLICLLELL